MRSRRHLLKSIAATGIGTAVFHRSATASVIAADGISVEMIKQAEWISGIELTEDQRKEIVKTVEKNANWVNDAREVKLTADVPMAVHFNPTSHLPQTSLLLREAEPLDATVIQLPVSDDQIALLPVNKLSWLVRTQKISSVRLTKIYLERLKKYGPMLRCVITLTEELALQQAAKADQEIKSGIYRGSLHGIPWGAKDLIAVPGYPTSWGIPHYKDRELDQHATVAKRLEEAGAVLCAKLSLGALAQGDKWFGGMTRNPWDPNVGSSGSSAGSASAVVAGLVGFTLGSETLGSIISPSIRCGASSLRPTFGRVSRFGCMPLSWSLDKIGPICRSMEDCALVFDTIHGADGLDQTAKNYDFNWPNGSIQNDLAGIRIGYTNGRASKPAEERETLKLLKSMGAELVEVKLPSVRKFLPLISIIDIEAASVFDDLLRAGHTEGWNSWDEDFRAAQYVSAVDYVRIQRARTLLVEKYNQAIEDVDVVVDGNDLIHSNFTGHPQVVMPIGYSDRNGGKVPQTVLMTGKLNQDDALLAVAEKFQQQQSAHRQHPDLDGWLEKFEAGEIADRPDQQAT